MKRFEIRTICAMLVISLFSIYGMSTAFCQGLKNAPGKKGIERLLKPESVEKSESVQNSSANSIGIDKLMKIGKKFSFNEFEKQKIISLFSSIPGKFTSTNIYKSIENITDYKIRQMIVSNDIDYKILQMKVRKDIDYKINVRP